MVWITSVLFWAVLIRTLDLTARPCISGLEALFTLGIGIIALLGVAHVGMSMTPETFVWNFIGLWFFTLISPVVYARMYV